MPVGRNVIVKTRSLGVAFFGAQRIFSFLPGSRVLNLLHEPLARHLDVPPEGNGRQDVFGLPPALAGKLGADSYGKGLNVDPEKLAEQEMTQFVNDDHEPQGQQESENRDKKIAGQLVPHSPREDRRSTRPAAVLRAFLSTARAVARSITSADATVATVKTAAETFTVRHQAGEAVPPVGTKVWLAFLPEHVHLAEPMNAEITK